MRVVGIEDSALGKWPARRAFENRRLGRVGEVYIKIRSITRGNGLRPYGFTNLRLSQITGFMVTGIVTPSEETLATRALAQAAAQAPQGA